MDEIGELPLDVQGVLLRVLETHKVMRIGAKEEIPLDIRVIAATNRDLAERVNSHCFRADLYYRLNIMSFSIPPLRQRQGDIFLLSNHFLSVLNSKNNTSKRFAEDALLSINEYSWPDNIRELQNAITRAYYLCDATSGDELLWDYFGLPSSEQNASTAHSGSALSISLKDAEKSLLENTLRSNKGNIKVAAQV